MTSSAVSRRSVLHSGAATLAQATGAAALVSAGLGAATSGPATAATTSPDPTYVPSPFKATPVPTLKQRHYLHRLGCGFSTESFSQMKAAGGPDGWLGKQLAPATIAEAPTVQALTTWFPDLNAPPATKWATNLARTKQAWHYGRDLAAATMLRRAYTTRPVLENMVGFWSELFNVSSLHEPAFVARADYDAVIRANALGKFEDLLVACELHPAMLMYLDNYKSTKDAPNENQGRELLELHTVGRSAGYTEAMVKDSARILTGYTVDTFGTWSGVYNPTGHATGSVTVLGFTDANAAADGSALAVRYLKYLARHPSTATNVATKLARHFVADEPSAALVASVAAAYIQSGTGIIAALKALVAHPDFLASAGRLVRNPIEDWVATTRALGVQALAPSADTSFALASVTSPQADFVYQWPTPAGVPLGDSAWCSAGQMLSSIKMHWNMAGGFWPTADVVYKKSGADWLPASSLPLDQYVDHLCRVVLGQVSDARLLTAVLETTGLPPSTVVTADHPVATYLHVYVMAALLDSPDHLRR